VLDPVVAVTAMPGMPPPQLPPEYEESSERSPGPQLPGLRGSACVANVGHGALMAVRHMFPAKLLLLLAAD
jgi:hypothetical protein